MDIDLNKAYDSGNFRAHVDANDSVESEEDDDEEESEDEETSTDAEDDAIAEEEVDHEELRQEEELRRNQAKMLSRSERFTNWLGEATTQLDQLVLEEGGSAGDECPVLVHHREIEREREDRPEREPYIRARQELDRIETTASGVEHPNGEEVVRKPRRTTHAAPSILSTTSTIPPEEIKRRVALEKLRNKEKTKIRVKGKQSAVRRGRKENRITINDYKGWI
ncbi:hypothetical protein GCK32_011281 [Trichostrongylus colubriformis]|uniref:Uncharacterized protein n=1 Tax=Trichostrongylus colubriformis TaxID=6319 RepID=A0AAN8IE41_TRICO